MQNDMRDRLVELLQNSPTDYEGNRGIGNIADHLIANDVVPVVKCSQCRKRYTTECALWYATLNDQEYFVERGEDFYCSYGEKK